MLSSKPWKTGAGSPTKGRKGSESQAKGRYPEVLIEGSKSLARQALKALFPKKTLVGIWPSGWEKGRKEAGGVGTSSESASALEFRS